MRKLILAAAVALFAPASFAPTAFAADCTSDVPKGDLTLEQAAGLYDCIKGKLRESYGSKDAPYAKEYQSWKAASTGPAAPGPHGNRFLMTFVNETGFDEYVKYSEERGAMPVGSVIAKESFNLSKKNVVKRGPLFFMEKLAEGEAPDHMDWKYSAVQPNGKVMKVKQGFCSGCHNAYEDQDALGYPDEDVRLASQ